MPVCASCHSEAPASAKHCPVCAVPLAQNASGLPNPDFSKVGFGALGNVEVSHDASQHTTIHHSGISPATVLGIISLVIVGLMLVILVLKPGAPRSTGGTIVADAYATNVAPILQEKCTQCHDDTKAKAGLKLHDLASILQGGENGPAVVPKNPKDSLLLSRINLAADDDDHMPPEGKPQLTENEKRTITRWIEDGVFDSPAQLIQQENVAP